MSILRFSSPIILILLATVPIIAYYYFIAHKKKRDAAMKFSNVNIMRAALGKKRHNIRQHINFYFSIAIVVLTILALADPMIPLKQAKEGVNVVLALDVSGSMQANDYSPTRLEAAKKSALVLIDQLDPKDHAGIVLFESGATTSAFLSPFKDRVADKLDGIAPREGRTAIGDGLALAVDMASSIPNRKKIVILLSDGVNNAGVVSPSEAIAYANLNNIQVYTIGMGSDQPAVIGYDFFGNPQYAELDETTLKGIAEETNGQYFKSVDTSTLDDIYKTISEEIEREREPTSIKNWIIAIALITVLVQLYIQHGKYRIIR